MMDTARDIGTLIAYGSATLQQAGITEPRREAAALMAFALGKDRSFIVAHPEHVPDRPAEERFLSYIERRETHEPFHYIKGTKEFYGLDFAVSPAVLIPRPETEMLVERGLEVLRASEQPRFCEVGVGSGCISISLLYHSADAFAVGLEISEAATEVAEANAIAHGVQSRFDILQSDVFSKLPSGKFDLIVSNPPYVPAADLQGLEADVREYEPHGALTDGADGLSIIRRLVAEAPAHLQSRGVLMFEFGYGQADAVERMFPRELWEQVTISNDFQGIPRTITATLQHH